MGLSASNPVRDNLTHSAAFISASNSAFDHSAATLLHRSLHPSSDFPFLRRWMPDPPTQLQVDRALSKLKPQSSEELGLTKAEFREFAVELFVDALTSNAQLSLARNISAGAAAITVGMIVAERLPGGVGAAVRAGRGIGFVGKMAGIYAVGVAGAVYLSLFGVAP